MQCDGRLPEAGLAENEDGPTRGEIDHACELLTRALTQAVAAGLPEPVKRVRRIHDQQLCAHPTVPAVRRLGDRLRATV